MLIRMAVADDAAASRRRPDGGTLSAAGADIPEGRREALPGVRLCVECQSERDRHAAPHAGYNRRGSKDGQLR